MTAPRRRCTRERERRPTGTGGRAAAGLTAAGARDREELVPGPHEIMLGDWQPAAGTLEAWLRTL